jgi:hypothetical protein
MGERDLAALHHGTIDVSGKTGATFSVTNSEFKWCHTPLVVTRESGGLAGTSATHVNVTGNRFDTLQPLHPAYTGGIFSYGAAVSYLDVLNNDEGMVLPLVQFGGLYGSIVTSDHITVSGNTGIQDAIFTSVNPCSDCVISSNVNVGRGFGNYWVTVRGVAGHLYYVMDNTIQSMSRAINYGPYGKVLRNNFLFLPHHNIFSQGGYVTGVEIAQNVITQGPAPGDSPAIQTGYNKNVWADGLSVHNNTATGSVMGVFGLGDITDLGTTNLTSHLDYRDNIYVSSNIGASVGMSAGGIALFKRNQWLRAVRDCRIKLQHIANKKRSGGDNMEPHLYNQPIRLRAKDG